jgi:hypothetical protein
MWQDSNTFTVVIAYVSYGLRQQPSPRNARPTRLALASLPTREPCGMVPGACWLIASKSNPLHHNRALATRVTTSLISISVLREWAADLYAAPSPDATRTSRLLQPGGLQILAEARLLPATNPRPWHTSSRTQRARRSWPFSRIARLGVTTFVQPLLEDVHIVETGRQRVFLGRGRSGKASLLRFAGSQGRPDHEPPRRFHQRQSCVSRAALW